MSIFSRIRRVAGRAVTFVQLYGQHLPLALQMILESRYGVVLIQGKTRKEEHEVSLLYVGRRFNYKYILNAIFSEYEVVEENRSNLLSYKSHAERLEPKADVKVVDIGWPYHRRVNRTGEYLELPDWINMSLVLGETFEETKKQFHNTIRRQDMRHIRIEGYRSEISKDRKAISDFYEHMYLPLIRSKHGDSLVKSPKRHVIRQASKGALLQVLKDDRVVAAGVVMPEDDALFFLWLGIAPECMENPPKAVMSAVYYFGIQYAHELGCWAVDFTGTRSFLGDGAYRFKRKWGAGMSDTFTPSSILIKPRNGHLAAARFCQQFPMLARREGGPEWLFLSMDQPIDEAYLKKMYAQFECDGINRLSFVDLSGQSTDLSEVDLESLNARVSSATLETFADHYQKNLSG